MPIKIDFSKVKDYSAIPEAKYPARITDIILDKAGTGNKMLVWTFQVTNGEFKNRKLTTNTVLIPESLWVLRNYLKALGAEVPLSIVEFEPKDVIGKQCIIDVGVHKFEGQDRNNIKNVLPITEAQKVVDSGADLFNKVTQPKAENIETTKVKTEEVKTFEDNGKGNYKPVSAGVSVEEPVKEEKKQEEVKGSDIISFLK